MKKKVSLSGNNYEMLNEIISVKYSVNITNNNFTEQNFLLEMDESIESDIIQ